MNDGEFAEWSRRWDERFQQGVDERFTELTSSDWSASARTTCPMPLEWHPAYQHQTWLIDWLNGTGTYGNLDHIQIPKLQRAAWVNSDEIFPTTVEPARVILTKKKCAGLAPYVGRPFVYVWWVAVDDYGRCIASDSSIEYK